MLCLFAILAFAAPFGALAAPLNLSPRQSLTDATFLQNGKDAQSWNSLFMAIKKTDACKTADLACIDGSSAVCVNGSWDILPCAGKTQCYALPLTRTTGTGIGCVRTKSALKQIKQSGAQGGIYANAQDGTLSVPTTPPPAPSSVAATSSVAAASSSPSRAAASPSSTARSTPAPAAPSVPASPELTVVEVILITRTVEPSPSTTA